MKVEIVRKLPPISMHRASKLAAHYEAALQGKIVVLPKGTSRSNQTFRRLGLTATARNGRLYIFKPKRTARRRSK